mmetsp:Transcript_25454/g.46134  ORF Transcript_25454/g.46134 Transcript_25454/m.46134 type:complete len:130 (+) Transcript_25454:627-1016(+)
MIRRIPRILRRWFWLLLSRFWLPPACYRFGLSIQLIDSAGGMSAVVYALNSCDAIGTFPAVLGGEFSSILHIGDPVLHMFFGKVDPRVCCRTISILLVYSFYLLERVRALHGSLTEFVTKISIAFSSLS